ncbi:MAG: carboxylate-amine ligase [Bacteroidetes bacterium]|nr:carboxylate-amine ligase [Bacteroidota bacterium]
MSIASEILTKPSLSLGIEEEYLIVDRETGNLIREASPQMLIDARKVLGEKVSQEFFQSQIEVGTAVCQTIQQAREELKQLRGMVSDVIKPYGLAIIASSSHPKASYITQMHTPRQRYETLAENMQKIAQRMVICGMHVHAGVEDNNLRIDLMNQASYVLPHLLALSSSSPFWEGRDTGLMSYRIAVWNEFPRTGLPEHFESYAELERHVSILVHAGVVEDSTKIWWDIRPSHHFPTLEMRITDVCTRIDDAICITALYQCWLHMLWRLRRENQRWRSYANMLLYENRWLAQRYGIDGQLIDFGKGEMVPYSDLTEELLTHIMPDAEILGCIEEVEHTRTILKRGTSAHWQREAYQDAINNGASSDGAIKAVVDMLIEETMNGV